MALSEHRLAQKLAEAWYRPHPSLIERVLLEALRPASWVYETVVRARDLAYGQGLLPVTRARIPVVSVGNLIVGGAGKTPVVIEITRRLVARGHHPALLSRGYGAIRDDQRLVADEGRIHLECAEAGDEPVLLARRCPGGTVLAGPDRALLAEEAAERGLTVAILDDGMQHRRLHRDLEIVVIDASAPLGNGRALPSGPLREPITALERADLVWLSRVDEVGGRPERAVAEIEALVARLGRPVVRAGYRIDRVACLDGETCDESTWLSGRAVHACVGVARPRSFLRTLTAAGARVTGQSVFGDHHAFTREEVAQVLAEARAAGAEVVTTEKDAQRLLPYLDALPELARVRVVVVSVELLEGEAALDAALDALGPAPPDPGPT